MDSPGVGKSPQRNTPTQYFPLPRRSNCQQEGEDGHPLTMEIPPDRESAGLPSDSENRPGWTMSEFTICGTPSPAGCRRPAKGCRWSQGRPQIQATTRHAWRARSTVRAFAACICDGIESGLSQYRSGCGVHVPSAGSLGGHSHAPVNTTAYRRSAPRSCVTAGPCFPQPSTGSVFRSAIRKAPPAD